MRGESQNIMCCKKMIQYCEENSYKPSQILKMAREKYLESNSMSIHEIDEEIEAYRREKWE